MYQRQRDSNVNKEDNGVVLLDFLHRTVHVQRAIQDMHRSQCRKIQNIKHQVPKFNQAMSAIGFAFQEAPSVDKAMGIGRAVR